MKTLILILALSSLTSFAESSKEAFCREHKDTNSISSRLRDYHNNMGIGNVSGLLGFKTGVCWWHSRFHRNAAYLVQMEPTLPKPSEKEVKEIAKRIIQGDQIVIIPGYPDFRLFIVQNSKVIEKALSGWMNKESIFGFGWIKGLKGEAELSVGDLQNHLDGLQKTFAQKDGIMFLMMQVKGLAAHSWLLSNIEKTQDGWNLSILDSLTPMFTYDIFISDDATSMTPSNHFPQNRAYLEATRGEFIDKPMIGYEKFDGELSKAKSALKDYCSTL